MCLRNTSKEVEAKYKRRKTAYKIYRVTTYSDGRKCFQTVFRGVSIPIPCNVWVDEKSRRDYPQGIRDYIIITGVHGLVSSYRRGFHCYLNCKDAITKAETIPLSVVTEVCKESIEVVKVHFRKPLAWGNEAISMRHKDHYIQTPVVVAREIKIAKGVKPCSRMFVIGGSSNE